MEVGRKLGLGGTKFLNYCRLVDMKPPNLKCTPYKIQASKEIVQMSGQRTEQQVNFNNASQPGNSINANGTHSCSGDGEGLSSYFHDLSGAEEVDLEQATNPQRVRG